MLCKRTKGIGTCGKRFLRNPERLEVGKILWDRHLTAEVYRAERAQELMVINDPEPHLYEAKTLRSVKEEYSRHLCFDKDPIKSLLIAQETTYQNMIHNLGLNPFFVHYWSTHQIAVYREHAARGYSSIAIDATGSILIRKLNRPNNNKSKHIFLYTCILNIENRSNFAITQMVSESQTTNSISFWLMEWLRAKVPVPKEVICDSSRALLTAVIQIFAKSHGIEDYIPKC